MRHSKILLCFVAAFAAASLFADAGNTLITFSTVADYYADGTTPVADGEWYALCWSPDDKFGGITGECEPVRETDKIYLMAPLAKNGHCPTVVFQLDSKVAPEGGVYCVYLLDTRNVDGKPAAGGAGVRKPSDVRSFITTGGKVNGNAVSVSNTGLASADATGKSMDGAWYASVGQPGIKAFRVEGDNVVISVTNMHPLVVYNVFSGATPSTIESVPLTVPTSGESGSAEFIVSKEKGQFFKVARQPNE